MAGGCGADRAGLARCYHAADVAPLAPEVLASIPPEGLAGAVLTAHPATRIVCSRFPAVTIFAANRSDGPVGRIEAIEPEDALATRPGLEVIVRRLPPGGATFLKRLIAGEPLGAAAAAAVADSPAFDLSPRLPECSRQALSPRPTREAGR